MFSHIMLGANDVAASKAFYDAILATLGIEPGVIDSKGRCLYVTPKGVLGLTRPLDGKPASKGNGSTIGFAADSPEAVEAWHAAGLAAGGTACEDPPGVRSSDGRSMYLAYLLDPAGNKLCAAHFMR
ncbi:VOC family protein [Pseudomonas sp. NCCP-436]|uniref:VOC family protein n=1 Tax=Pseudomonas sp. NCCP-436 TaxID=2842481 RepID=UPI001C7F58DB|nr:VOC family protein [Pseudomonas sp. NCCP-436]GIZ12600.1 hypothetical protein NCCP436_20160 [Pseudomonas sp. NCCP-436]